MPKQESTEISRIKESLVKKEELAMVQSTGDVVYLGPLYKEKRNGAINQIGEILLRIHNKDINVWECPFCLNEAIIKKEIIPSLILIEVCVPTCSEHEKNHHWNDEKCSGIEFYVNIIQKNKQTYRNIPVIIVSEEGPQHYNIMHGLKVRECDVFLSYYWATPIPKVSIIGKIKHILDKL